MCGVESRCITSEAHSTQEEVEEDAAVESGG
jgi:hypothetical protein